MKEFSVRVPVDDELYEKVRKKLDRDGLKFNRLIARLLDEWAEDRQPEKTAA